MGAAINVHPPRLQGCWSRVKEKMAQAECYLHHTKWDRQLWTLHFEGML